jgi:hypothetical protein
MGEVSLYVEGSAAMQRSFLPDISAPTLPSGTAFQPGCTRDKRLYIARHRLD